MWIYYYAIFGPGHQSSRSDTEETDVFEYFADCYDMEQIQECLHNRLSSHDGVVLEFWEIEKPPHHYVEGERKRVNDKMRNLRNYRKVLDSTTCFVPQEVDGEDATIQRNLMRTIESDVVRRLHRAGLMYNSFDVGRWRRGEKRPVGREREEILRIIRRAKKYPN
jgi:hypothetical protein